MVQLANGTVWLYHKSDRTCLAYQIHTFAWLQKTLTLLTNDLRVYTFDIEDTMKARIKNDAQNARTCAEQFSRGVKSIEERSSDEKLKLDHIRLFTRYEVFFSLIGHGIDYAALERYMSCIDTCLICQSTLESL